MRRTQTGQFIRGGQTTQHWYRMAVQVLRYALMVMLSAFTVTLGTWCYVHYDHTKFIQSRYWVLARINMYRAMPDFPLRISLPGGKIFTRSSSEVYRSQSFRDAYYYLEDKSVLGMVLSLQVGSALGLLSFGIFFIAGRKLGDDEHLRGAKLVPIKELKAYTQEKWKELQARDKETAKQSRYTMGGLEFPPDALQAQTGIFGTTGSGKTTLIKDLITSIRASGGHALIYDRDGDYAATYYDETRDYILNPFDARSHCWSPFYDADTPESFTQLYSVLIPERPGEKDPFWSKSARIVAEFVSRELVQQGRASNANLRDALMNLPIDKLEKLVHETPAEKFVGEGAGKMGSSVYATMLSELRFFEFLRDDGKAFSVRKWVKQHLGHQIETIDPGTGEVIGEKARPKARKTPEAQDGSFVFLTGHPELDAATRNITSAIMELAATALMAGPKSFEPKLFFIIDELATLNRLPFLTGKLAEVRKVGGCFVVGFQVLSQLEDIYGREGANTVLGNLNNTIFGSTPDHSTAERFSKALGMADQIESRENISVGANENRDGVGFIKNRFERAIATPTQIMRLPQFQAYFTFAYDSPTSLVKFKRSKLKATGAGLVPYTGAGFGTGSLDPDLFVERAAFEAAPIHKRAAEFQAWLKHYQSHHLDEIAPNLSDSDKRALWEHYASERMKGIASGLIGPPSMNQDFAASMREAAATNIRTPHAYTTEGLPEDALHLDKPGPRIIVIGATDWTDEKRLWDLLDQTLFKHNDMVLCHKGMFGAESMAADWANARSIPQMVFSPKFDLHGDAAPEMSEQDMMNGAVRGVLAFDAQAVGSNIRALAMSASVSVKDITAHKIIATLPDYPLSGSPQDASATPAAHHGADTAPFAGSRRAPVKGASSRRPALGKLGTRTRKAAPPRARTARGPEARARQSEGALEVRLRAERLEARDRKSTRKAKPTFFEF